MGPLITYCYIDICVEPCQMPLRNQVFQSHDVSNRIKYSLYMKEIMNLFKSEIFVIEIIINYL